MRVMMLSMATGISVFRYLLAFILNSEAKELQYSELRRAIDSRTGPLDH